MKNFRLVLLAFLMFGITACGNDTSGNDVKLIDKTTQEVEVPKDISEQFEYFFEKLPADSEDEATEAFFKLEEQAMKSQLELVETVVLNDEIQMSLADCFIGDKGIFDVSVYQGERINEILEICGHGFTFVPFNGVIYPVVNYHSYEGATAYVSREAASYINLKILELDDYITGHDLTQEDLISRLMSIETHLIQYTSGETAPSIYELYKTYFYEFIPIKFRTAGTMDAQDALFNNYIYFVDAYQDSVTAELISKYIKAIEDNDYVIDDKVLEVLNSFSDEIQTYFTSKLE